MNDTPEERRRKANAACARYRANNIEKVRERERNYRAQNPEKLRQTRRESRARNPEPQRAYQKKWRERNKEKHLETSRRWRAEHPGYDRMLQNARNLQRRESLLGRPKPDACEVCARTSRQIVYDHCHKHGHARGWLCDECNKILGLAQDNPAILLKLAAYLKRTRRSVPAQSALSGL
jgi:hypothetical protein